MIVSLRELWDLITYWCLFCTSPCNVYLLCSCFLAHQHSRRLLQTRRLPWLQCCRCLHHETWNGCTILASWSLMPARHRNCNTTRSMHNDWPPTVDVYCVTFHLHLTHQDLKRMAEILHTPFSNVFSLKKKISNNIQLKYTYVHQGLIDNIKSARWLMGLLTAQVTEFWVSVFLPPEWG